MIKLAGTELREISTLKKGSTIVIPENTVIYISLPKGAYLKAEEMQEGIKIQDNKIILQGIKISGLNIYYYFDKPIAPPVGVEQIAKEFMQNRIYQAIAVVIIAIILVLYFNRGLVAEKIENFILKYSELSEVKEQH